jgi:hypothetical protein
VTHEEWNSLSKPERIEILKRRAETAMRIYIDKFGIASFKGLWCKRGAGEHEELYEFYGEKPATIKLNTAADTWSFED